MINIMFVDHYIGWEKSRIEGVKKYVKPDFLHLFSFKTPSIYNKIELNVCYL